MARRVIEVGTELTEVALVAATIKTVLEVTAAANHPIDLVAVGISFDGIVVTDEPVEVTLAVKSVAGTGSAANERDTDEDRSGSIQTVGRVNMSAEGTVTYDFFPRNVHPQAGFEIWHPPTKSGVLPIIAAGILGLRCLAGVAVNAHAFFVIEE